MNAPGEPGDRPEPLEAVVDREEIRDLALRYARALERRDPDAMADLFVPDASVGAAGSGTEAIRELTRAGLEASPVIVLLVANHLVEVTSAHEAAGEVWSHGFAQTHDEGFVEQLIRYEDTYRRHDGRWLFVHRRHRLWFGTSGPSPFAQPTADWPTRQSGVGDLPFDHTAFVEWYRTHGPELPKP